MGTVRGRMTSSILCVLSYLFAFILAAKIPEKTISKIHLPQTNCRFSVHNGGPNGEEISGTNLNSELYYKIKCNKEKGYCLHVANCTVKSDRESTEPYLIIDENGCTLEPSLFEHVQYEDDFTAGIYNPLPIRFRGSSSSVQFFCSTTLVPTIDGGCSRKMCTWNEYGANHNFERKK
uniref:ZP domain-containing protein n=2 Tax=Wuchereria bancrofti TaxID=6293 RepID=A0A1I8F1D9_WUCBA